MQPAKAAVEGRTLVGESQRTVGARAMVKEVSARCSQPDAAQAGAPGVVDQLLVDGEEHELPVLAPGAGVRPQDVVLRAVLRDAAGDDHLGKYNVNQHNLVSNFLRHVDIGEIHTL